MKTILTFLFLLLGLSLLPAQQSIPAHKIQLVNDTLIWQTTFDETDWSATSSNGVPHPENAPEGWLMVDMMDSGFHWRWDTVGPRGYNTSQDPDCHKPREPLESATGDNGFLLFEADHYNTIDDCSDFTMNAMNAYVEYYQGIDMTNADSVILYFTQWQRLCCALTEASNVWFSVSNDGGLTWEKISVAGPMATGVSNGTVSSLDITPYAAGNNNVTFRFHFEGLTQYHWEIDDVMFVDPTGLPMTYEVTFDVNNSDTGDPIEDAVVTINGNDYITGSNGQVTANLADDTYDYTVDAAGFFDYSGSFTVDGASQTVTVPMLDAGGYDVLILVEDASENPIDGATVNIDGNNLMTDNSGMVDLILPDGEYNYAVSKEGYANYDSQLIVNGDDLTENVLLQTLYTVQFEVKNSQDVPIDNAQVAIGDDVFSTNADGMVSIELTNGSYTAEVSKTGYEDATKNFTVDNSNTTIPVVLYPVPSTYSIYFNVEDEQNNPIEGAEIELSTDTVIGVYSTNTDGETAFNDLPNGTYNYQVSAAEFEDTTGTVSVADGDEAVTVTMAAVGIESFDARMNFRIHPNPSNGIIEIYTGEGEYTVSVFDALGKKVHEQKMNEKLLLNLSEQSTGIYIIRLQSHKMSISKRFILK